jgi:predicted permease
MDNKHKHLEFIQSAIARMGNNLFLVKGWTITLVSALSAAAATKSSALYAAIAMLPAIVFWALDGYLLSIERCLRDLYDHVRQLPEQQIDFSMDVSRFKNKRSNTTFGAMTSKTLLWYYVPIILVLLLFVYGVMRGLFPA